MLEQRLLQVAVAQPAGAEAVFKIPPHLRRGDELEQLHGEILVGVRLRLGGRAAVHDDAHDFFAEDFFIAENLDGVAVALAHLLAVEAGHERGLIADLRLWNHEGLAVLLVELDGDVARHLHVLLLVAAHGHDVGIVD